MLSVFNHGSMQCFQKNCSVMEIDVKIAQSSHYRYASGKPNLADEKFFKQRMIEDKTILKYKDELMEAVEKTLKEIKFNPN